MTNDVSGNWMLDTETASPISGLKPVAGFPGVTGVLATDSTGAVSASQVWTVSLPTLSIASILSAASSNSFGFVNNTGTNANWLNTTEDKAVTVSGTATAGLTVNLTIADDNGFVIATNGVTVAANGSWSATNLSLSTLDNSVLQVIATLSGTTVSATNTTVTHDKTAARIFITAPSTIPKSSADISGGSELPNTVLKLLIYDTNATPALLYSNNVTTSANGNWATNTGSGNLVSGGSGFVSIQVEPYSLTTDTAGNIVQRVIRPQQFVQNGAANTTQTISIGTIAGDDLITLGEVSGGIQVTGVTSLTSAATNLFSVTVTDGTVTNTATVTANTSGNWSVDLSAATPSSGSLPAAGLFPFARFTATAVNAYGIATTVIGLNIPTVVRQITHNNTPTVLGSWTQVSGDAIAVTLNGVVHSVSNGNLTVTSTNWSLTSLALADGYYEVVATVARSGFSSVSDITTNELLVDTRANIAISGGATNTIGNPTPVISGTSSNLPPGSILTLNLDINADTTIDLVYKTTLGANGSWSVNTATAVPISGTMSAPGLSGPVLLGASASDPAGNVATATQTLIVDVTPPSIALTFNSRTANPSPVLTGTSDLPLGSNVTVQIDPNNDGDYSDAYTYIATVQASGNWSVQVTNTLSGTVGVKASASDAMGNTSTITKPLTIELTPPAITVTRPLDANGNNILDATEDNTVVVKGATANIPVGSTITVMITDGNTTLYDTASVGNDGSWSLAALNLSSMANGLITVTATYTDDLGNAFSDTATVTHDKSGSATIDAISRDTGFLGDFITSDTTLVFYGSAPFNNTVTLLLTGPGGTVFNTNVTASSVGQWTFDYTATTLPSGNYSLQASSGGSATQAIVIDATAPIGPVTVSALTTTNTTPALTGTATVTEGETFSVAVNGVTYNQGDGHLSLSGTNWTLQIPAAGTLSPASSGFSGIYTVTATIQDVAGNKLINTGLLTIQSPQQPLIFVPVSPQSYNTTNLLSVTGGSGTGAVTYVVLSGPGLLVGGNKLWVTNGTGVIELSATKAADSIYSSSAATASVTAAKAPVTLALNTSANPSGYRDLVTFTAFVSTGTGTLQFLTNLVNCGNAVNLSAGSANTHLDTLPRGTNLITAIYSGDSNCLGATNTLLQVVTNHPPTASSLTYNRSGLNRWKIKVSDLLTNVTDLDNDVLTLNAVGVSTNGITLVPLYGYLQYYNTNLVDDQFTCTVTDGFGGTKHVLLTLTATASSGPDGGLIGQHHSLSIEGSQVTIQFGGIPGYSYHIQRSVNLISWDTLATTNAPPSGLFQFQDTTPPQPTAFYRLMWNGQ